MANVDNISAALELGEAQAAARALGLEPITLEIRRREDIAPAIETLKGHADALSVVSDGLTIGNRTRINILALGARLPTIYADQDKLEGRRFDVLRSKPSEPIPARRRLCR
jgi:putative ABC transport system substrate-binding protein